MSGGRLLTLFGGAIFLSAFLLFAIQPMFAKMVLPQLGGAPAVWSVAMVFFQGLLLLGYLYAHALQKFLAPRAAVLAHIAVTALAFVSLPIVMANFGKPPVEYQAIWLIGLFGISIGLPFFALSANGPLLQAWFSQTKHPQAHDPYFLYSSSNFGSLLALLSYPLLLEPELTLRQQSHFWTFGYCIFLVLLAILAFCMFSLPLAKGHPEKTAQPVDLRRRLLWTGLAFIPSALLVATTAHISTDVAAVPFLWILPLVLYLLTFIIVFARKPVISQSLISTILPFALLPLLLVLIGEINLLWPVTLIVNLVGFFFIGLRCHGLLAEDRPPADRLTEFYFFLSLGGVLGGLFSGLLAPHIFNSVVEYPLLIVASLLTLPNLMKHWREGSRQDIIVAMITLVIAAVCGVLLKRYYGVGIMWAAVFLVIGTVMLADRRRPMRILLIATGALLLSPLLRQDSSYLLTKRSFFGVHKVHNTLDGHYRVLEHGTTMHGAQMLDPKYAREPITYYAKAGNFGQVVAAMRRKHSLQSVGVVGLGTGSIACLLRPGEKITYFEIDPVVVSLAREQFTFLKNCGPDVRIVLGDARLTLAEELPASFDLLAVDAFTSDAVPLHLLTIEALQLYISKLKSGGAILLHISNRNLEMESMLATAADELGIAAFSRAEAPNADKLIELTPSHVVVIAKHEADLGALISMKGWRKLARTNVEAWRDDFSNILGALWRRLTGDRYALADRGQVAAPQ